MSQSSVPVSAVWLRKATEHNGNRLEILVEVDGVWRKIIDDTADDGPISHIVESSGIRRAAIDDLEPVRG